MHALLDEAMVAQLAVNRANAPLVLPVLYARDGNRLLLHGSTGAGALRLAAQGAAVSVAVTILDGLVFASTMFNASANYRSVVVFGRCTALAGEEKIHALWCLSEHLMPGRWEEVPSPTPKELAATQVLSLPLDRYSMKARQGGPLDDVTPGVWSGVLPVQMVAGTPVADVRTTAPASSSLEQTIARFNGTSGRPSPSRAET
jgi:uncharacterized protein